MPKLVEEPKKVAVWVQEKQQLEVELSQKLLAIFNAPPLINTLRELADKALEEILTLTDVAMDHSILLYKSIVDALKAEQKANMALLKNFGDPASGVGKLKVELPAQLNDVRKNVGKFSAAECSDLIRLYGTIIEEAAKRDKAQFALYEGAKKQYKIEMDKFLTTPAGKDFKAIIEKGLKEGKAGPAIAEQVRLDDLKKAFRVEAGEAKGKFGAVWNQGQIADYGRHRINKKVAASDYSDQIEKAGIGEVQASLIAKGGGQSLFALKDSSTIGKIDRMFGLVPAADISGTTTDTIFFMEKLFSAYYTTLDPVFYVLPLATIVAGAHHSLVEVALPLSLNGIIDYSIGAYGTLLPKGAKVGAGAIQKVLQEAEKDPRNRRMLLFYNTAKKPIEEAGCYLYEPSEKQFFDFANGKKALPFFQKFKTAAEGWPSKAEVFKMVQENKLA